MVAVQTVPELLSGLACEAYWAPGGQSKTSTLITHFVDTNLMFIVYVWPL